jgi:molybdopterin-biosynthesis enzyme MoeA-like protein
LAESVIANDLAKLQDKFPGVEIGSYPHYRSGILGLSLVLRSADNDSLDTATFEVIELIRKYGGEPRAISIKSSGVKLKSA